MQFLNQLGGLAGIVSLFGIAVNLYRAWKQQVIESAAREVRHAEVIRTMEKQTEALSHLTDKVSGIDERVAGMDDRLVRVEDHARMVSEVIKRGQ